MSKNKMMTDVAGQIKKMQEKHAVLKVPSAGEIRFLIDEYKGMRATVADELTRDEVAARLERLSEIEELIRSYRDFHHGAKH